MALALAAASAIWRLGVTGGRSIVDRVGVVCMASGSSSASAGGVAGVTIGAGVGARDACACAFFISSIAAHLVHSICFRYIYCCWGPTTVPGRTMRMNAIASLAVNPYFQMRYAPM